MFLVEGTETEQWGYLETYYPEEWGESRYVLISFLKRSFCFAVLPVWFILLLHLACLFREELRSSVLRNVS